MKSLLHVFFTAVSTLSLLQTTSISHAETYTSADKAGAIYQLQGEYMGVVESWGGTWGAQVIATSQKKVEIHLLDGGLPGQGFSERTATKLRTATIDPEKKIAEANQDSVVVTVRPESITIADAAGKKLGILTKITRESSTLGAKPPAGALVLFAVGGTNDFKDAKTDENGLLKVGCSSKELFDDHHLHLEFMTPFQPDDSGQRRGNSGLYIQGRFEVQVLDSFGLKGEDNECGGIYQIARPKLNMCYPPLTWQTYDIDFTSAKYNEAGEKTKNATISVKLNGVAIHSDRELPNATPGGDKEANKPGPLFLQNHNNPVVYRNIWAIRK